MRSLLTIGTLLATLLAAGWNGLTLSTSKTPTDTSIYIINDGGTPPPR